MRMLPANAIQAAVNEGLQRELERLVRVTANVLEATDDGAKAEAAFRKRLWRLIDAHQIASKVIDERRERPIFMPPCEDCGASQGSPHKDDCPAVDAMLKAYGVRRTET